MRVSSRRAVTEAKAKDDEVNKDAGSAEVAANGDQATAKTDKPKKAPKEKKPKPEKTPAKTDVKTDADGEEKAKEANGVGEKTESVEKARKPLKKCLPPWVQASSAGGSKNLPSYSRPINTLIKEALEEYGDAKGNEYLCHKIIES